VHAGQWMHREESGRGMGPTMWAVSGVGRRAGCFNEAEGNASSSIALFVRGLPTLPYHPTALPARPVLPGCSKSLSPTWPSSSSPPCWALPTTRWAMAVAACRCVLDLSLGSGGSGHALSCSQLAFSSSAITTMYRQPSILPRSCQQAVLLPAALQQAVFPFR
jgi:hypothetical protein